mgnify:CR=1 FL=1
MESILGFNISEFLSPERLTFLIRAALLIVLGIPTLYFISKWCRLYLTKHLSAQQGMIAGKVILYAGLIIIFVMVLREFGFELGPLLGAAGIVGIAVGFASQTSVSNIISGIFLITEQPFVVGDVISTGSITGEVLSIDFLSIKLRTFDNKFVRIPNESILKSEVTTLTRFPIRRADIMVSVAYKEDIAKVKEILLDIANEEPLCLQEPEPLIIFSGFGASSIDLQFSVWAAREDWLKMKNQIYEKIKSRFDSEGIEIPFPHVSLYAGSATSPLPVEIAGNKQAL